MATLKPKSWAFRQLCSVAPDALPIGEHSLAKYESSVAPGHREGTPHPGFGTLSSRYLVYRRIGARSRIGVITLCDFYTMGAREAALACRLLSVKQVVLMHFGTFPVFTGNPEELKRQLKDFPHTQVWPREIGKPVKW